MIYCHPVFIKMFKTKFKRNKFNKKVAKSHREKKHTALTALQYYFIISQTLLSNFYLKWEISPVRKQRKHEAKEDTELQGKSH